MATITIVLNEVGQATVSLAAPLSEARVALATAAVLLPGLRLAAATKDRCPHPDRGGFRATARAGHRPHQHAHHHDGLGHRDPIGQDHRSMMTGWIRVHRALAEHQIWLREPFTMAQAWVDLLMRANYHN